MKIYTEQETIFEWLENNFNKLPIIQYEKDVYDFIVANCDSYSITKEVILFNVNGIWQSIILKK